MPRTLEQEFRIVENIARADTLVGAIEAVNVAVEAEEHPAYAEYLDTTVREFLEEEHRRANAAHKAYLRELGIRPA
jgi:arginine/ornithine N-succinyltransferase beta subunit